LYTQPNYKEDVPIKKETTVRRFCVTEVIIVERESASVFFCSANINEKQPINNDCENQGSSNRNKRYEQIMLQNHTEQDGLTYLVLSLMKIQEIRAYQICLRSIALSNYCQEKQNHRSIFNPIVLF
jgi:hypothetical protein